MAQASTLPSLAILQNQNIIEVKDVLKRFLLNIK
jgi:hypothetical protein